MAKSPRQLIRDIAARAAQSRLRAELDAAASRARLTTTAARSGSAKTRARNNLQSARSPAPPPFHPPTARAKRGLTLIELLKRVHYTRIATSKRDRVTLVSMRLGGRPKGSRIFTRTLTYDKSKKRPEVRPHRHWVEIRPDDWAAGYRKFNEARLLWNCDCEDFMYTWEYSLNRAGAARIKFCNGEAPIEKNPRNRAGLCKHALPVLGYIRKQKL